MPRISLTEKQRAWLHQIIEDPERKKWEKARAKALLLVEERGHEKASALAIGNEVGVSQATIYVTLTRFRKEGMEAAVIGHRRGGHGQTGSRPGRIGVKGINRLLSDEAEEELADAYESEQSIRKVAAQFGINRETVRNAIARVKTRREGPER